MAKKPKSGPARTGGQSKGSSFNPPKHSQFKKGVSGNLAGRPPGSKNLMTLLKQAAEKPVTATVGGKKRTISTLAAITMQLATKAANGDHTSIARFLDWIDKMESRAAAEKPTQFPLDEADVEVLRATYARMKQCQPDEADD